MIGSIEKGHISIYLGKPDVIELDSEGIHSGEMVIVTAKHVAKAKLYIEVYDRTIMRPDQSSSIEWRTGLDVRECHVKLLRDDFDSWIREATAHTKRKLAVTGSSPQETQVIDFNQEGLGRDHLSKTRIEKLLQKAA